MGDKEVVDPSAVKVDADPFQGQEPTSPMSSSCLKDLSPGRKSFRKSASFTLDAPTVREFEKVSVMVVDRPDVRAPLKSSKTLHLGDQKVKRQCSADALTLFKLIDPEDEETKRLCCPKLGKDNVAYAEAQQVSSPDTHFHLDMIIESGSFCSIQRGLVHGEDPGMPLLDNAAVKCVATKTLSDVCTSTMFNTEVQMAQKLVHRNVVATRCIAQDTKSLYLVMLDLTGGDLFDRMSAFRLAAKDAARYVWQMVSGISYIHGLQICHRDIRPENYLFSSQNPDAELQLIDFSLARLDTSEEAEEGNMRTMVGCLNYIAPEVARGKYNKKCDVWSVGVVSFLCCCGKLPIYDPSGDSKSIVKKLLAGDVNWSCASGVHKSLVAILRDMLTKDPLKRVSAATLGQNAWLKKMSSGTSSKGDESCCTVF